MIFWSNLDRHQDLELWKGINHSLTQFLKNRAQMKTLKKGTSQLKIVFRNRWLIKMNFSWVKIYKSRLTIIMRHWTCKILLLKIRWISNLYNRFLLGKIIWRRFTENHLIKPPTKLNGLMIVQWPLSTLTNLLHIEAILNKNSKKSFCCRQHQMMKYSLSIQ